MLVSTKGRYALRVMVDLAEHFGDGMIPLKEIAQRQEISEKYLESVLKSLVQARLLIGARGKGGGYRLAAEPERYTVGDILRPAEGSLAPIACLADGAEPCPRAARCKTLPMWRRFAKLTDDFFDGITLADLARDDENGGDYVI